MQKWRAEGTVCRVFQVVPQVPLGTKHLSYKWAHSALRVLSHVSNRTLLYSIRVVALLVNRITLVCLLNTCSHIKSCWKGAQLLSSLFKMSMCQPGVIFSPPALNPGYVYHGGSKKGSHSLRTSIRGNEWTPSAVVVGVVEMFDQMGLCQVSNPPPPIF